MSTNYMTWVIPELPDDIALPAIIRITDATIMRRVSTHTSLHALVRTSAFEATGGLVDYEKDAHDGDSAIAVIVVFLLKDLWPNLKAGPATALKAQLVSDKLLADLGNHYALPSHLLASSSARLVVSGQVSIKASMFEAYVAGLIEQYRNHEQMTLGQAIDKVSEWLHAVFRPIAIWARDKLEVACTPHRIGSGQVDENASHLGDDEIESLAAGASAQLNEYMIGRLRLSCPIYEETRLGEATWMVVCEAEAGSQMYTATATRHSKKAAKNVAAWKVSREMGLHKRARRA